MCIVIIVVFNITILFGQTKISLEPYAYSGYQYNVFNSPDKLFDNDLNEYLDKEALLVSDNFLDLGYDAEYQIRNRKQYKFDIETDFWYRSYFNHTSLDQKQFSLATSYERNILSSLIIGVGYNFKWKDKIGTSITGEEFPRSYVYSSNEGEMYIDYALNKNLDFLLKSSYKYKNFYEDNTDFPLDQTTFNMSFGTDYQYSKTHGFAFDFSFTNKQYENILASDRNGDNDIVYDNFGNIIKSFPTRQLQYYDTEIKYDYKMLRSLVINSAINFRRRTDLYEGYYDYIRFGPDLGIRYKENNISATLKIGYRQKTYNERNAYTLNGLSASKILEYTYFNYQGEINYQIYKPVDLFLKFSSANRDSNSDIDYRRSRRAYSNFELLFGVNSKLNILD